MTLAEEIEQLVEAGVNPEVIKNTLVEERTNDRIRQRKELLSWSMTRLDYLTKELGAVVPDQNTYDAEGNLTAVYSEKQFKSREELLKKITKLQEALDGFDWVALQKIRSDYNSSFGDYWKKNNNKDYYLTGTLTNYYSPFLLSGKF